MRGPNAHGFTFWWNIGFTIHMSYGNMHVDKTALGFETEQLDENPNREHYIFSHICFDVHSFMKYSAIFINIVFRDLGCVSHCLLGPIILFPIFDLQLWCFEQLFTLIVIAINKYISSLCREKCNVCQLYGCKVIFLCGEFSMRRTV